ncbi:hypothetical protein [Streptomyces sp. NBC_01233]|uniref:hypothetical protein n=1 Tax=Streptomyces sp. NBC_01233 TaxID=2903787 RepID=UPI002E1327EE|nr:hypothetical protein OG332_28000 [Streptomyces sp. NBC_01233]
MSTEAVLPAHWNELFGEPAAMRLASADAPGGGGEDLAHSRGPWSKAADAAGELRITTAEGLGKMAAAHEGVEAGTAGLSATAALAAVRASWEKRVAAVRDECGSVQSALLNVAREIGEIDENNRLRFSYLVTHRDASK